MDRYKPSAAGSPLSPAVPIQPISSQRIVSPASHPATTRYGAPDTPYQSTDDDSRWRLQSATTHQLMVPQTRLHTVGDRAFGIAGARVWNDLPSCRLCAIIGRVQEESEDSPFSAVLQSLTSTRSSVLVTVVPCPWSFGLRHDNLDVFNNTNNNNNNNSPISMAPVCQKTSQALAGRQLQSCYTVDNKSLTEKECLEVTFKCSK